MALTARQVWEGMLTELSKVNAPSMLLQDFNYFFNKAINQYINKRYNIYDVNQQTTDDLRVLKATTILTPKHTNEYDDNSGVYTYLAGKSKLFGATYEVILPDDYLHMLNCVCIYKLAKNYKCYDKDNYVQFAAKRLTADSWSVIVNDYYNRPLPERPYYYLHNVNQSTDTATSQGPALPTNKYDATKPGSTDQVWTSTEDSEGYTKVSEFPRTIKLGGTDTTLVNDVPGIRHANASKVRCEIRYGKDDSVFILEKVFIDYIKAPQTIRLTQEQVDLTEDTSQIMEFPDYVCQEIINELVTLVMENTADPRLQSHPIVTQSIANPVQQQTSQPQPQQRG